MAQPQSKCRFCKDRYPGCHSSCKSYIDFRKELDTYNENLRDLKDKQRVEADYKIEAKKRMKRR